MARFDSELRRINELRDATGKAVVHALFPNEFEYYLIALELVNADGETEQYMVFPYMPQTIDAPQTTRTGVYMSAGGVMEYKNTSFTPFDINLNGSFGGTNFKFVQNEESSLFASVFSASPLLGIGVDAVRRIAKKGNFAEFSPSIKTGYGAIKMLENLFLQSQQNDQKGRPYYMFLYNLAFNHNFLVSAVSFSANMSRDQNFIWNYNFVLKTLAPANAFKAAAGLQNSLSTEKLIGNSVSRQALQQLAAPFSEVIKAPGAQLAKQFRLLNTIGG